MPRHQTTQDSRFNHGLTPDKARTRTQTVSCWARSRAGQSHSQQTGLWRRHSACQARPLRGRKNLSEQRRKACLREKASGQGKITAKISRWRMLGSPHGLAARGVRGIRCAIFCRRSVRQCIARLYWPRSTLHPPPGSRGLASIISCPDGYLCRNGRMPLTAATNPSKNARHATDFSYRSATKSQLITWKNAATYSGRRFWYLR